MQKRLRARPRAAAGGVRAVRRRSPSGRERTARPGPRCGAVTGRCRMRSRCITTRHSLTLTSGATVCTRVVMMSRTKTRCCSMPPRAMSRSDSTPTSRSPSRTGRKPMFSCSMSCNAPIAVAPDEIAMTGRRFLASSSLAVAKGMSCSGERRRRPHWSTIVAERVGNGELRFRGGTHLLHRHARCSLEQRRASARKADHRELGHHEIHRPRRGERQASIASRSSAGPSPCAAWRR